MSTERVTFEPGQSAQRSAHKDLTFRSYSAVQAAAYAKSRGSYSKRLLDYVINYHTSTGGELKIMLDVGCGPGNATRDLALYFDNAIGCDPGQEMIAQATAAGYKTKMDRCVIFEVCAAEHLDQLKSVGPGSVDLITCAMSAHWFHLEQFYPAAARVLKPGGTLAMWTCGSFFVHPNTPHADAIQQHLRHLELDMLRDFKQTGNNLSYNVYDTLELPWTLSPPVCEAEFKVADLHRKVWNRDGQITEADGGEFLSGSRELSLAKAREALGTSSMVTRWRQANQEKLDKGEIRDCLEETFENIGPLLDVQKGEEDEKKFVSGMATGLVMLKRDRS